MKKILKTGWPHKCFLLALLAVPLGSSDLWRPLKYGKIAANTISFVQPNNLHIQVDSSASPLAKPFEKPVLVKRVSVRGKWSGKLNLDPKLKQGDKGNDDFVFRLGLIEKGDQHLNFFQKTIAPEWILNLHELAGDAGLKQVYFLNLVSEKELLGKSRQHPLSDLLFEDFVAFSDGAGDFKIEKTFDVPINCLGLWLASDGDDTKSKFDVDITEISVETVDDQ